MPKDTNCKKNIFNYLIEKKQSTWPTRQYVFDSLTTAIDIDQLVVARDDKRFRFRIFLIPANKTKEVDLTPIVKKIFKGSLKI